MTACVYVQMYICKMFARCLNGCTRYNSSSVFFSTVFVVLIFSFTHKLLIWSCHCTFLHTTVGYLVTNAFTYIHTSYHSCPNTHATIKTIYCPLNCALTVRSLDSNELQLQLFLCADFLFSFRQQS